MATLHESPGSKILLVTFEHHGPPMSSSGFGTKFALDMGYNHIYISCKKGSQYQSLSFSEVKETFSDYAKGKDVYTYGTSLGGYASIYYAAAFSDRTTAIAFSPRNSAHPLIRENSRKSEGQFKRVLYVHETFKWQKSLSSPFVVLDPMERLDELFVSKVVSANYPSAHIQRIVGAGHYTPKTLSAEGVLKNFILSIINEKSPIDVTTIVPKDINPNLSRYFLDKKDFSSAAAMSSHVLKKNTWGTLDGFYDSLEVFCASYRHIADRSLIDNKLAHAVQRHLEVLDLFNEDIYLSLNGDVSRSDFFHRFPLMHYLIYGCHEGRRSGGRFDAKLYLNKYSDVRLNGVNPLIHYIRYGKNTGRSAS